MIIKETVVKGPAGFGFTIKESDSGFQTIVHLESEDSSLENGDFIMALDGVGLRGAVHDELVQRLRRIEVGAAVEISVCRPNSHPSFESYRGPSKDDIRNKVWNMMEETNLADFPRPCHHRIPNFRGSKNACEKLLGLDCFRKAGTVKVNPDKPQEMARFLALQFNKKLLVPTPRLRHGLFNHVLPPYGFGAPDLKLCCNAEGVKHYGIPVPLKSNVEVDLIVVGSVAVSEKGFRIGKGEGFADIEWGMMATMGAVHANTIVVTIVHDCQVMDIPESLVEAHDIAVDIVLTPRRIIYCSGRMPRPGALLWDKISATRMREIPSLSRLATLAQERGQSVCLPYDRHQRRSGASGGDDASDGRSDDSQSGIGRGSSAGPRPASPTVLNGPQRYGRRFEDPNYGSAREPARFNRQNGRRMTESSWFPRQNGRRMPNETGDESRHHPPRLVWRRFRVFGGAGDTRSSYGRMERQGPLDNRSRNPPAPSNDGSVIDATRARPSRFYRRQMARRLVKDGREYGPPELRVGGNSQGDVSSENPDPKAEKAPNDTGSGVDETRSQTPGEKRNRRKRRTRKDQRRDRKWKNDAGTTGVVAEESPESPTNDDAVVDPPNPNAISRRPPRLERKRQTAKPLDRAVAVSNQSDIINDGEAVDGVFAGRPQSKRRHGRRNPNSGSRREGRGARTSKRQSGNGSSVGVVAPLLEGILRNALGVVPEETEPGLEAEASPRNEPIAPIPKVLEEQVESVVVESQVHEIDSENVAEVLSPPATDCSLSRIPEVVGEAGEACEAHPVERAVEAAESDSDSDPDCPSAFVEPNRPSMPLSAKVEIVRVIDEETSSESGHDSDEVAPEDAVETPGRENLGATTTRLDPDDIAVEAAGGKAVAASKGPSSEASAPVAQTSADKKASSPAPKNRLFGRVYNLLKSK